MSDLTDITCVHHTDAERAVKLSCPICTLRERDEARLTWMDERDKLIAERDALLKFINEEMQMTATDPRVTKLAALLEKPERDALALDVKGLRAKIQTLVNAANALLVGHEVGGFRTSDFLRTVAALRAAVETA